MNAHASKILAAITCGDVDSVRALLEQGVDVNCRVGKDDLTPLHVASKQDQSAVVQLLLERGAKPCPLAWARETPQHLAAESGCTQTLRLLLQHGADIEAMDGMDMTPLHYAVDKGHLDCVRILLEAGANAFALDWDNDTPLHNAIFEQHFGIVQSLLTYAHLCKDNDVAQSAWYSLAYATICGSETEFLDLVQSGIDINIRDDKGYTVLSLAAAVGNALACSRLLELGANTEKPHPPLHKAAYFGHQDCVHLLLEHGIAIQSTDDNENSPLHLAAEGGHRDIAQLFLKLGADIEARNTHGETPLISAAYGGHTELIATLLEHRANVNAIDGFGYTALSRAAWHATDPRAIRLLFEYGAVVPQFSVWGGTVWHLAARNENSAILEEFIARRLPLPNVNEEAGTLLHYALERPRNLEALLKYGVNVSDAVNWRGKGKPLHAAAMENLCESAMLLLRYGAEPNEKDYRDKTPLQCAEEEENEEMVRLLKAYGAL